MTARDVDRIRFVTRHFHGLQGLRIGVPLGLVILSAGGTAYFDNPAFVFLRIMLPLGGALLAFGAKRYYARAFGEVEDFSPLPAPAPAPLSIYSPCGASTLLPAPPPELPALRRLFLTAGLALAAFLLLRAFAPPVEWVVDESWVVPPWENFDSSVVYFGGHKHSILAQVTDKGVLGQMLYALCGAFAVGIWLARGWRASQAHYLVLGLPLLGLAALGARLGSFVTTGSDNYALVRPFLPALVQPWIALLLCGAAMIATGLLDHRQLVRALKGHGEGTPEAGR